MKKIIKIIGSIILAIILLIILVIGYYWLLEKKEKEQKEKVVVAVEYNLDECNEGYPLLITISNNSDRTVSFVDYKVEIRRKGHSTNIARSEYSFGGIEYESDNILKPDMIYSICWQYKLDSQYEKYNNPDNLEFEIRWYKSIRFKQD